MTPRLLDHFHRMEGCSFGDCFSQQDARGGFSKFIDAGFFERDHRETVREVFSNHSMKGVIRGFHLQWPPADHAKMITCMSGSVFDVLLDLRRASATYRCLAVQVMRPGQFAYLPRGIAHAFQSLEDRSTMLYATTSAHDPTRDGGVNPLTCGIEWPIAPGVVSERDLALPPLDSVASPFD